MLCFTWNLDFTFENLTSVHFKTPYWPLLNTAATIRLLANNYEGSITKKVLYIAFLTCLCVVVFLSSISTVYLTSLRTTRGCPWCWLTARPIAITPPSWATPWSPRQPSLMAAKLSDVWSSTRWFCGQDECLQNLPSDAFRLRSQPIGRTSCC